MSILIASLSEEVLYLIVGLSSSREVCHAVEGAFGSATLARALSLLSQLQALRQGDDPPVDYLGHARVLVEELASTRVPFDSVIVDYEG